MIRITFGDKEAVLWGEEESVRMGVSAGDREVVRVGEKEEIDEAVEIFPSESRGMLDTLTVGATSQPKDSASEAIEYPKTTATAARQGASRRTFTPFTCRIPRASNKVISHLYNQDTCRFNKIILLCAISA
jgi:hypothetical protein